MGLSRALIDRLHKAVKQDRCGDAVLFMTQLFAVRLGQEEARDEVFLRELTRLGSQHQAQGELEKAEEHFMLVLALYEKCFATRHIEVLPSIRGLAEVLKAQDKHKELLDVLDRGVPVINRLSALLRV